MAEPIPPSQPIETHVDVPRRRPVFGVDTMESVAPKKLPSKAEQERIANNATHPSGVDTSRPLKKTAAKPIHFPEPKTIERDGKRYTTIGKGTYLYNLPTGRTGPNGEWRRRIGDIENTAEEAVYINRWPHPASKKMMPSIELRFEQPILIRDPRTGETVEFQGVAYGDRVGEDWDGMLEPSTKRQMREERERGGI